MARAFPSPLSWAATRFYSLWSHRPHNGLSQFYWVSPFNEFAERWCFFRARLLTEVGFPFMRPLSLNYRLGTTVTSYYLCCHAAIRLHWWRHWFKSQLFTLPVLPESPISPAEVLLLVLATLPRTSGLLTIQAHHSFQKYVSLLPFVEEPPQVVGTLSDFKVQSTSMHIFSVSFLIIHVYWVHTKSR